MVLAPIDGHWFLRGVPQDVIKRVAIPTSTINFAIFMLSNIYCKLNKFDAKSEALSEINAKLIVENPNNLAKLQKNHGDFFAIAATQHELQHKAIKKLPQWLKAGCLLDKRAYEQCTSEDVAIWKAHFFKSQRLLSLTGGLGVDDWAWANTGTDVTSVDNNGHLNCLVKYNFSRLNVNINRHTITAENFIESAIMDHYDLVYIDPDRRDGQNRIGSKVDQYSPNIFAIIEQFPKNAFLIKVSPMIDSDFLLKTINRSLEFYSVVHQNEVKELLMYIHPSKVNVPHKKEMVNIERQTYFYYSQLEGKLVEEWMFFEPNSGIFNLKINRLLHDGQNTVALNEQHTFFKTKLIYPKQMGRLFTMKRTEPIVGGLNKIGKFLRDEMGVMEASITARECKIPTDEIRKTLKLKESDQCFVMITKNKKEFEAWLCEKFIYSS